MDRVTVSEAAERLGVTQDAIRQRVKRGTIRYDKESDGRVYVYLDSTITSRHVSRDDDQDALVDALRDQVASLKDEVEAWREEARRKDHLLAAALERIPAIEAPPDAPSDERERHETPPEEPGQGMDRPNDTDEPRAPWWRRMFGV